MFDTDSHGNAVEQLLKQFIIIKENKILVSLDIEWNTIFEWIIPVSQVDLIKQLRWSPQ